MTISISREQHIGSTVEPGRSIYLSSNLGDVSHRGYARLDDEALQNARTV